MCDVCSQDHSRKDACEYDMRMMRGVVPQYNLKMRDGYTGHVLLLPANAEQDGHQGWTMGNCNGCDFNLMVAGPLCFFACLKP